MKEPLVLTITQLNTYVKSLLDGDDHLAHVFAQGEISNFTNHYKSGHLYFSLKDERCVIKAVMFAQQARRLRFMPEDGMRVLVRGRVTLYEQTGQYQFYVDDMQPDGIGALNLAFEQRKRKLEAEGLFLAERKKPLPIFPKRIGVVTSATGAAVHDIQTILARRWPLAELILAPVLVQGEQAAAQIAQAIAEFNRKNAADVLIVGRGGGSLEDLWPFNEELVAYAVADSEIPVISAVGHETDFTICDFVADMRAPTPSAAAELAVPELRDVQMKLLDYQNRVLQAAQIKVQDLRQQWKQISSSRVLQTPLESLAIRQIRLDDLETRLGHSTNLSYMQAKNQFAALCGKLHVLSPIAVLARGYSMTKDVTGKTVSSAQNVAVGAPIAVRLADGTLECIVEQVRLDSAQKEEGEAP